jgi:hypothetical protein
MHRVIPTIVTAVGATSLLLATTTTGWAGHLDSSINGPFGGGVPSPEEFATCPKALPFSCVLARAPANRYAVRMPSRSIDRAVEEATPP